MYTHNRPMRPVRASAPSRFAAAVLVTLVLLSAACSEQDPMSRINAPPVLHRSSNGPSGPSGAASGPSLGGASSFAVLGGTGVTCTGSAVTGNVGVSPGVSVTGFPPTSTLCTVAGTIHVADATAALAYNNFVTAYDALLGMTCEPANNLTGQDLGGMTLASGVYCFNTTAGLTGQLTLTGSGPWVFQIGTGLTTGAGSGPASVVMAGGQACNVFWQVGSQATIGTGTAFQGNILAGTAIVFSGTGTSLVGRALAKAEVTMTGTNVTLGTCGAAGGPQPGCKISEDRVTGGGWISGPSGAKATFAVSGGINIRKNAFRGQLEYEDNGLRGKSDDVKVKGTGVTAYIVLDGVTRRIEGTAKVNGVAGFTYQVDVSDNGERGRNDVFAIRLWNASGVLVYSASGKLKGGNIQLHTGKSNGRSCQEHGDGGEDDDGEDGEDGEDDH